MALYAGEYVAIHQKQLIDHDRDELALLRRLDAQYPNDIVLMKQVRPLPEPELRFRSFRKVRRLLQNVEGAMSQQVIDDRENKFPTANQIPRVIAG